MLQRFDPNQFDLEGVPTPRPPQVRDQRAFVNVLRPEFYGLDPIELRAVSATDLAMVEPPALRPLLYDSDATFWRYRHGKSPHSVTVTALEFTTIPAKAEATANGAAARNLQQSPAQMRSFDERMVTAARAGAHRLVPLIGRLEGPRTGHESQLTALRKTEAELKYPNLAHLSSVELRMNGHAAMDSLIEMVQIIAEAHPKQWSDDRRQTAMLAVQARLLVRGKLPVRTGYFKGMINMAGHHIFARQQITDTRIKQARAIIAAELGPQPRG